MTSLHDMNPIGRFDDRAFDYAKYRPSYPSEAIDAVLSELGPLESISAADIGAGTGIFARLIGERGVGVIAVEPGACMRMAAAPHPKVTWVDSTAEATGLAAHSLDLVLCAQSFHWFRQPDALFEFARILRPGGRLSLVWNRRRTGDSLTEGYRQAIIDVGGRSLADRMELDTQVVSASGLFSSLERYRFRNLQQLDLPGLLGRARSASHVPKDGPEGERLAELLSSLHERCADANGLVTFVYETEVNCAMRR